MDKSAFVSSSCSVFTQFFLLLIPTWRSPCFVVQARTLLALLHSYYLEPTGYLKVHTMNHSPADFNFEEVLQEVKAVDRAMAAEPASGSPPQPSPEGSSGGSTQPQ